MGRNAKFYKSSKAKKKQSSTQAEATRPLQPPLRPADKKSSRREVGEGERDSVAVAQRGGGTGSTPSSSRLKSKLWKGLEAERAKEGKGEIATPREAGIDYIRQWEKKRR